MLVFCVFLVSQAIQSTDATRREILASAVLTPSSPDVSVQTNPGSKGATVTIAQGKDAYPGLRLVPAHGNWDLSKFGHVEAKIANTGSKPLFISLRVDNPGNWQDNPWDTESQTIQPGQTGVVTTIFGYAYGYKKNFALNPKTVNNVLLFTTPNGGSQSFRIESVFAAGPANETPPISPDDLRIPPPNGTIYPASGTQASGLAQQLWRATPALGRWDLTHFTQVDIKLKNNGSQAVTPRAQIESNGGNSDWISVSKPIQPGADGQIIVEFFKSVDLTDSTTISGQITSDAVSAIVVDGGPVTVTSVRARCKTADIPSWLGQRPPVAGDWVKTLDERFKGPLNAAVWSAEGFNYYDKVSHWSKSNVILGNGPARLRYEKKTGFQNDDPKLASTPYASGFLDTYGLWTQRYGYFESRIKVPTAPGLWPAFWMMPDRGLKVGPEQWKRQDTANGGMEFDIMEHLTRWGPYRFNIAMHYDGYQKDHKQLGSDKMYVEPDKDGFVTFGLLWEPGLAVFYYNGKEALRWKNPRISNVPSTLMFTMPSGGWDNNNLDDKTLPADLLVDYVRVWQLKGFVGK